MMMMSQDELPELINSDVEDEDDDDVEEPPFVVLNLGEDSDDEEDDGAAVMFAMVAMIAFYTLMSALAFVGVTGPGSEWLSRARGWFHHSNAVTSSRRKWLY